MNWPLLAGVIDRASSAGEGSILRDNRPTEDRKGGGFRCWVDKRQREGEFVGAPSAVRHVFRESRHGRICWSV